MTTTRFAPSPNGFLHLGHGYAAMMAHDMARQQGGTFHLRIEDIDGSRSRPEYIKAILDDVQWLGLSWDGAVYYQSHNLEKYALIMEKLRDMGLIYPCFCTRKQLHLHQQKYGGDIGLDGVIYPGICKALSLENRARLLDEKPHCWRLDMEKSLRHIGGKTLYWHDVEKGKITANPAIFGDIILVRKDAPASYHLAATWDDHEQQMDMIIRGEDLFPATHIHRLLQEILRLDTPHYHHHRLITDGDGRKLSKSDQDLALSHMRETGMDGQKITAQLRLGKLPLDNLKFNR